MIKKYLNFITESDENLKPDTKSSETDASDSSKFVELKDELKNLIEDTIEKSGGEYDDFVSKYLKNPQDVKIEGLISDSDIYEFYLKWRNDIDEILNDVNFFDEVPSEINSFGLYEYLIKGTERAILEALKIN